MCFADFRALETLAEVVAPTRFLPLFAYLGGRAPLHLSALPAAFLKRAFRDAGQRAAPTLHLSALPAAF